MNRARILEQRERLRQLFRAHLGQGSPYALVDFPDHPNVGDSAIWLGELAVLREVTGRDPSYVSTWHDFDYRVFADACPGGVLLIHGGGNLGDLWPHHQQFRERLLTTFKNRKIVQLPQSIFFKSDKAAARFSSVATKHPDFSLYVRDTVSQAFAASRLGLRAELSPDTAMMLDLHRQGEATVPLLALLRTDCEGAALADAHLGGATIVDWLTNDEDVPTGSSARARERQARTRLARGVALLSQGERLITDRLHGHLLALLMGIPHVFHDNSYGKLSAYAASWTAGPSPIAGAPGNMKLNSPAL